MTDILRVTLRRRRWAIEAKTTREHGEPGDFSVHTDKLRGAQREVTALAKSLGWAPIGRWRYVWRAEGDESQGLIGECARSFRL